MNAVVTTSPLMDAALDAVFQALVVGITGLPGTLVRPRWQPVPPTQPSVTTNWAAIGVTTNAADAGPAILHDGTGSGADIYIRHEAITVLVTFYGPNSHKFASLVRDDIAIPQNTEGLLALDMRFVSSDPIRAVPELVNQQWLRRRDIALQFRRKITRSYPVLNLQSAEAVVQDDTNLEIDVTVPPNGRLPA